MKHSALCIQSHTAQLQEYTRQLKKQAAGLRFSLNDLQTFQSQLSHIMNTGRNIEQVMNSIIDVIDIEGQVQLFIDLVNNGIDFFIDGTSGELVLPRGMKKEKGKN